MQEVVSSNLIGSIPLLDCFFSAPKICDRREFWLELSLLDL
jgi:hypothetical protein